jgi:hypothetical protein
MAQVASNILAGPARIFLGAFGTAVAPVTGAPPTLFAHTAGVPSGLQTGFTEVGYTTGPATFDYKATKEEIVPEQSLIAVDVFTKEEMAQLSFTAYERVFVTLKAAFDNIGSQSDATGELYYAGNGTNIIAPSTFLVFMSAIHRDNTAKFSWVCLYKAYSVEGAKLPFEKSKPTTYQVTLKALADTTRTAGDQVFQMKNER